MCDVLSIPIHLHNCYLKLKKSTMRRARLAPPQHAPARDRPLKLPRFESSDIHRPAPAPTGIALRNYTNSACMSSATASVVDRSLGSFEQNISRAPLNIPTFASNVTASVIRAVIPAPANYTTSGESMTATLSHFRRVRITSTDDDDSGYIKITVDRDALNGGPASGVENKIYIFGKTLESSRTIYFQDFFHFISYIEKRINDYFLTYYELIDFVKIQLLELDQSNDVGRKFLWHMTFRNEKTMTDGSAYPTTDFTVTFAFGQMLAAADTAEFDWNELGIVNVVMQAGSDNTWFDTRVKALFSDYDGTETNPLITTTEITIPLEPGYWTVQRLQDRINHYIRVNETDTDTFENEAERCQDIITLTQDHISKKIRFEALVGYRPSQDIPISIVLDMSTAPQMASLLGWSGADLITLQSKHEYTASNVIISDATLSAYGDTASTISDNKTLYIEGDFVYQGINTLGQPSITLAMVPYVVNDDGLIIFEPTLAMKVAADRALAKDQPQALRLQIVDVNRNAVYFTDDQDWSIAMTFEWEQEVPLGRLMDTGTETRYH